MTPQDVVNRDHRLAVEILEHRRYRRVRREESHDFGQLIVQA